MEVVGHLAKGEDLNARTSLLCFHQRERKSLLAGLCGQKSEFRPKAPDGYVVKLSWAKETGFANAVRVSTGRAGPLN